MEGSKGANKGRVVPNEENPPHSQNLMNTLPEEALNDFIAGECYLMCESYAEAVQKLSSACEKYTQHFGEVAPECRGVYYQYAKALFHLHTEKCGILESEEFISEQEKSEAEKELFENRTLVYQRLTAARSILERQGDDDFKSQLELAEILMFQGELTMAYENDPRLALCYFKDSLELRKRHLEPDNRLLAIASAHVGLAQLQDWRSINDGLDNFYPLLRHLQQMYDNLEDNEISIWFRRFATTVLAELDKASELTNAITPETVKAEMEQELAEMVERLTKIKDLILRHISEDDFNQILTMKGVPSM